MFEALVETLEIHNYGVRAYEQFNQLCHQSAEKHPDHAIFFLTLSVFAERFVNQYDESPLTSAVADAQKEKVLGMIQKMEMILQKDSAPQNELLNIVSRDIMNG